MFDCRRHLIENQPKNTCLSNAICKCFLFDCNSASVSVIDKNLELCYNIKNVASSNFVLEVLNNVIGR